MESLESSVLDTSLHNLTSSMTGSLAIGFFASTEVNPAGANGLFYGHGHLVLVQISGVTVAGLYSFILTFVLLKVVQHFVGMKISNEEVGVDVVEHGEKAY